MENNNKIYAVTIYKRFLHDFSTNLYFYTPYEVRKGYIINNHFKSLLGSKCISFEESLTKPTGDNICVYKDPVLISDDDGVIDQDKEDEYTKDYDVSLGRFVYFYSINNNEYEPQGKMEIKLFNSLLDGDMNLLEQYIYDPNVSRDDLLYLKRVINHKKVFLNDFEADIEQLLPHKDYLKPINIDKAYNNIKKTLRAQDDALLRLLVDISRNLSLGENRNGILVTGNTGVGKTKSLKLIGKYLERPVFIVDTSQITQNGYVGKSMEDVIQSLYFFCDEDIEKTEHAILYFDEIDKKGTSNIGDVAGRDVLNNMLAFLSGATYTVNSTRGFYDKDFDNVDLGMDDSVDINTSNMIIIAGGAFMDVYQNKYDKPKIGFNDTLEKENEPTIQDFIDKACMPAEFMGRFTSVIHFKDLTKVDLKDILINSDESTLKLQIKLLKDLGVILKYDESFINAIVNKAYILKTGARALSSIVDNALWKIYLFANRNKFNNNRNCIIEVDEKILENPDSFKVMEDVDINKNNHYKKIKKVRSKRLNYNV